MTRRTYYTHSFIVISPSPFSDTDWKLELTKMRYRNGQITDDERPWCLQCVKAFLSHYSTFTRFLMYKLLVTTYESSVSAPLRHVLEGGGALDGGYRL